MFHKFMSAPALVALATLVLSGCAGTTATSEDPLGDYEAAKTDIPSMVKEFSSPNLGVLLNSFKINGLDPLVLDLETLGSARNAEMQGVDLLKTYLFEPAKCQAALLRTYQDNENISGAYSYPKAKEAGTTLRVQLRSHPTVEAAAQMAVAQHALARECPTFTAAIPQGEAVQYTVTASDYPVEGAQDGVQVITKVVNADGTEFTTVGVFQRVGNLDLRLYFDGKDPVAQAKAAQADLPEAIRLLGVALVNKS